MRRIKVWFLSILTVGGVLLCTGFGTRTAAKTSAAGVKKTAEQTVATDVKTQKAVDAWAVEEKKLLDRIDQKERRLKRILWEQEKTSKYLKTLENKVGELREKAAEMEKINAKLLPILDQGVETLTTFVKEDVPFDKRQRLNRIHETAHTLDDYDVDLLAKTQALFDAVSSEVDFGYSVDVRETEIEIKGRSTRVKLLKVGRVGLYALSMDGEKAYAWTPLQNTFVPVQGSVRDIDEAVQIVERIRIIELTKLPMGRPVAGHLSGGRIHE